MEPREEEDQQEVNIDQQPKPQVKKQNSYRYWVDEEKQGTIRPKEPQKIDPENIK